EHQIEFMRDFEKQDGIAFLLIYFTDSDRYYYMRFEEMLRFIRRRDEGGLKHFKEEELDENFFLSGHTAAIVPYLEGIQKDLDQRE
ncbi:MAG: Holliday junction resolvase RecU, partial [Clostridia bacterium]|nr:Holliday junction resolvase RecU [Clostridia bacterium]